MADFELSKSDLLADGKSPQQSSLFDDAYNRVANYVSENPIKTGALLAVAATSGIGLIAFARKRLPEAIDSMSAGGIKDLVTCSLGASADNISFATQQNLNAARETFASRLVKLWIQPASVPAQPGETLLGLTERVFRQRAQISGETVTANAIRAESYRIGRLNGILPNTDISNKTLNVMSPDYFARISRFMQRKELALFENAELYKPELNAVRLKFLSNVGY